jgi:trehalose/maltose hydrolase-like predicted phosphorylase
MRSDGPVLSFKPSIPKKWNRFGFRILYRGSVLSVGVDKQHVTLSVAQGEPVEVEVFGQRRTVDAEGVRVALPADRVP